MDIGRGKSLAAGSAATVAIVCGALFSTVGLVWLGHAVHPVPVAAAPCTTMVDWAVGLLTAIFGGGIAAAVGLVAYELWVAVYSVVRGRL